MTEEEIDFSEISEKLKVKESVIDYLASILPFKDSFQFIISVDSNELFWDLIDLLPRHQSMHLHSLDIEIPTTSKDFPKELISPTIQTFWASNCISHGQPPTTINSRSISRIYPEGVRDILSEDSEWTIEENSQRAIWTNDSNISFDIDLLCNMCNAYISNGIPWIFLEVQDLRLVYNQVFSFLHTIDDKRAIYKIRQIERKLKNFNYSSTNEVKTDVDDINSEVEIPDFTVPPKMLSDINRILIRAKEATIDLVFEPRREFSKDGETTETNTSEIQKKGIGATPPSIPPIDDWTRTRTEALVSQMNLPLQQRSAFQMTPAIFCARMGQNFGSDANSPESPFEPLSLSELLFSNANGDVAPMPYMSLKADLPSSSFIPFCKSALKRFVARKLLKNGFESASDACLEILVDVLVEELRKISQNACRTSKCANGNEVSDSEIIFRTLGMCDYDVASLQQTC